MYLSKYSGKRSFRVSIAAYAAHKRQVNYRTPCLPFEEAYIANAKLVTDERGGCHGSKDARRDLEMLGTRGGHGT